MSLPIARLVGPNRAVELFGIKLVGVNAENGKKLLFSVLFVVTVLLLAWALRAASARLLRGRDAMRVVFWTRQAINLGTAAALTVGIASIWFDDPTRLTTALGLVTAGLAFALQRVVTAFAGYVVILRGKTFNVGDRIMMGRVRGDVIALGFTQTTIMEMGQPPPVQADEPAIWVRSREYTGRIVTVSNAVIFDEPVYNYTREFPYLWEEMSVPFPYAADRAAAEHILLEAAQRHSVDVARLSASVLEEMQRRYFVKRAELRPRVYYRLTDNWLEMSVRFIVEEHGIRAVKDAMSRDILRGLERAGMGLASTTIEVVGVPPLRLEPSRAGPSEDGGQPERSDTR